MFKILDKLRRIGIVTETIAPLTETEIDALGMRLKDEIEASFGGSLAIRHIDAGSCNACELELHQINNPYYSVEQYGVHFVASPRHADVLWVTGPVSRHMQTALLRTVAATPTPKLVIASGDCAVQGGEFGVSYASCGAVRNVVPVDGQILGCPPTPVDLIRGLLAIMQRARHTTL